MTTDAVALDAPQPDRRASGFGNLLLISFALFMATAVAGALAPMLLSDRG